MNVREVWNQQAIPVIYCDRQRMLVRLPYREGNRHWLRGEGRRHPLWLPVERCWQLPRAWFNLTVRRLVRRHGSVYIIQPFRAHEKCAPACWDAQGYDCQCSCLGENHGSSVEGRWFIVSETCAIQWKDRQLACRLIQRNDL